MQNTKIKKTCSKCLLNLNLENFGIQNREKNQYKPICRDCTKKYNKQRYKDNKQEFIKKAEKWRDDNREKYIENQKNYNELRKAKSKNVDIKNPETKQNLDNESKSVKI